MAVVTPSAVQEQIASGRPDSIYLLLGDDEHQKGELAAEFEQLVEEELRAFNVDRFYGGDTPLGSILNAARTLPMMAPRRVVILLRAERALQPKPETEATAGDLEALEAFVKSPPPEVVLVLASGPLNASRRLTKRLTARATVVRCGEVETVADAKRFVRAKMNAAGKRMSDDALTMLSQRIGPDVNRLRDEVERLLLFVGDRVEIESTDVRDVAGPAAAYDNWAVTGAIERGNAALALRELGLALEQGAVPYMVIGQLGWVARTKLSGPKSTTAIDAVFRTDLALKRSAGEPRVLLERLVVQLCEAADGRGGSRRR